MNKKFLTGALCALLVGGLLTTGTFAYFTDKDAETNAFSVGDVTIDLVEVFDNEAATEIVPGRDVNKDVFVKNTNAENPAFVRVHIAFPDKLDNGPETYNASKNLLHWNFTGASVAEGQWSWAKTAKTTTGTIAAMPGYPGNGGDWNSYKTTIGDEAYTVYVATYNTALAPNTQTATQSLDKVYLEASVDTVVVDGVEYYQDKNGNKVKVEDYNNFDIKVVAEGVQAEGFADAYTALNKAFGVPGTYNAFN